jgi:DNA/RNA-binding domain of Phe-tRNA-synthetase-like protein
LEKDMIETRIHEQVFERFPDFRRGIVMVREMENRGPSEELESMLQETLSEAAERPVDLKEDPRTAVWNEAYRRLGCNPNKFPPAHLALLKRVQKAGARIPLINKAVSIMNHNSIRGVMPVGGDHVIDGGHTLALRPAEGNESFIPLDHPEKVEHPDPGEVIYVVMETGEVMCRRWNWRNGFKTRITEETRTMVMNIDALGEGSDARATEVRNRVAEMLERFCKAETFTALLSPSQPFHRFDV